MMKHIKTMIDGSPPDTAGLQECLRKKKEAETVVKSVQGRDDVTFPTYNENPPVPLEKKEGFTFRRNGWKEVFHLFLESCDHDELKDDIFFQDENFMVIYDGYPKARYHLLLLPKPSFLDITQPSDLRSSHLPRLRLLHALGGALAKDLVRRGAGEVRCGYHALPSMEPLHLHIISQDFDSYALKRPRHWNIFTTDIFMEPLWVEEQLERLGQLDLDVPKFTLLKEQTPHCHLCGAEMGDVELLKTHHLSHDQVAQMYGPPRSRAVPDVGTSMPKPQRDAQRVQTSAEGPWRRGHSRRVPGCRPGHRQQEGSNQDGGREPLLRRSEAAPRREERAEQRSARTPAGRAVEGDRKSSTDPIVARQRSDQSQQGETGEGGSEQEPRTEWERRAANTIGRPEALQQGRAPPTVCRDELRKEPCAEKCTRRTIGSPGEQVLRKPWARVQEGNRQQGGGEASEIGKHRTPSNVGWEEREKVHGTTTVDRQARQGTSQTRVRQPHVGKTMGGQGSGTPPAVQERPTRRWVGSMKSQGGWQDGEREGGRSDRAWWRAVRRDDYLEGKRETGSKT